MLRLKRGCKPRPTNSVWFGRLRKVVEGSSEMSSSMDLIRPSASGTLTPYFAHILNSHLCSCNCVLESLSLNHRNDLICDRRPETLACWSTNDPVRRRLRGHPRLVLMRQAPNPPDKFYRGYNHHSKCDPDVFADVQCWGVDNPAVQMSNAVLLLHSGLLHIVKRALR